jgi:hypothetical protein
MDSEDDRGSAWNKPSGNLKINPHSRCVRGTGKGQWPDRREWVFTGPEVACAGGCPR